MDDELEYKQSRACGGADRHQRNGGINAISIMGR